MLVIYAFVSSPCPMVLSRRPRSLSLMASQSATLVVRFCIAPISWSASVIASALSILPTTTSSLSVPLRAVIVQFSRTAILSTKHVMIHCISAWRGSILSLSILAREGVSKSALPNSMTWLSHYLTPPLLLCRKVMNGMSTMNATVTCTEPVPCKVRYYTRMSEFPPTSYKWNPSTQ